MKNSENVDISNVKILGYRANSDGVDICNSRNVAVHGCFIRTLDDLIVIKTTHGGGPTENIHAYTSSGIYNPIRYGERDSWDKGGSINLLTPGRLIGDYVPAMAPYSCNIDVEKAEPDPNFGQGWEHILDEVDKQQLETQRPIRTSADADLVFGEQETLILNLLTQRQAQEVL